MTRGTNASGEAGRKDTPVAHSFWDQVKAELNRRDKIGKLDSALLFLASSIGLAFAILQVLLGGMRALIVVGPALVLGSGAPFYVGYVQGAIWHNWAVDRVRGWTYLVLGVGYYAAVTTLEYGTSAFRANLPIVALVYAGLTGLLVALFWISISLPPRIFLICGRQPNSNETQAVKLTVFAAIWLAVSLWGFSGLASVWLGLGQEILAAEIRVMFLPFGLGWLVSERRIRGLSRKSYELIGPMGRSGMWWKTFGFVAGFVMIGLAVALPLAGLANPWFSLLTYGLLGTGMSITSTCLVLRLFGS